ncbi:MAG: hypothetical protein JW724_05440 [Candidatus Altiarchaeota archaeon]|nr:hypothetical protein [Candidatus Altiarchaeota archaeon]
MPENIMIYEAFIPSISQLTKERKTFKEVEKEFGIEIEHFHNSPIEISTRRNPSPDEEFRPGMTIKVVGDYLKIREFRKKYQLF